MRSLNGLLLSVVLGLVGAGIWVGLSQVYDTWLLVVLACVVGGLAGYGMAVGSKAKGGAGSGLLSALVCLVCCLAAKGTIAWFRASEFVEEYATVTDEDAYDHLVNQTYLSLVDEGVLHGDETTYPLAVVDSASEQWRAMSDAQREEYKAGMQTEWSQEEGSVTGVASVVAFLFSWSLLDIVCVCSAVGTAFKIGSHKEAVEQEIPAWALGPGRALTATPQSAAALASGATGPMAVPMAGPASGAVPLVARPIGRGPTLAGRAAGPATGGSPTGASGASESDSFWTRLGSEAPARETPSIRRTGTPTPSDGGGEAPQAEAA